MLATPPIVSQDIIPAIDLVLEIYILVLLAVVILGWLIGFKVVPSDAGMYALPDRLVVVCQNWSALASRERGLRRSGVRLAIRCILQDRAWFRDASRLLR